MNPNSQVDVQGKPLEKPFENFLEAAPDAIVAIDDDGRIIMLNKLTENMFGYDRSEMLGQKVEMLIPERFREKHIKYRSDYSHHPRTRPMGEGRELAGLRKNGQEFPVEISLSPLRTAKGTLAVAIIRDIGLRKQQEAKFRGLLESAPDGIVVVDKSGKMVIVNRQAEILFGYNRDELIGQPVEILVPDQYRHNHVKDREDYTANPRTRPMGSGRSLSARRKDGSEFPVEISLSPLETEQGLLITSIIRDISERFRAEKEAKRLTAQPIKRYGFAVVTSLLAFGIVWLLSVTIHVERPLFVGLAAIALSSMYGGMNPGILATVLTLIGSIVLFDPKWTFQLEHRSDLVLIFLYLPLASLLVFFGKRLRSALQRAHEATLRSAIDNEKLKQERELRERFVSTLAHDLRSPITTSKLNAQMLFRYPEKREQFLNKILNGLDRADRMIQDLLDANRIQVGKSLPVTVEMCEINSIIPEIIEELTTVHGSRFNLEMSERIEGYCSPEALRRIIENLASNAVKYGEAEKPVTISISRIGRLMRISVHNYGNPLTPEQQATIFEPFQRTKTAETGGKLGWGLGLTLVRGLAEALKGKVWVESSEEKGTIFTVELPLDARDVSKF